MIHVYEFEVFEDEGWYIAYPFDFLAGVQGKTYAEACEAAADWLRGECGQRLMDGEGLPCATSGNEPRYGGAVVTIEYEA